MQGLFKKAWFKAFCGIGFIITFTAGLTMFIAPDQMAAMLSIPVPESGFNPYFVRLLGLILVPCGLCYLFAALDPDASRSLLVIVSSEKLLAVAYSLAAFISGTVGVKVMGVVAGDGLLMLVGVYCALQLSRELGTMDQNDDAEEEGEE